MNKFEDKLNWLVSILSFWLRRKEMRDYLSELNAMLCRYAKCNITPVMVQVLYYCRILAYWMLPRRNERMNANHIELVQQAYEFYWLFEDLGVLILLEEDLLAMELIKKLFELIFSHFWLFVGRIVNQLLTIFLQLQYSSQLTIKTIGFDDEYKKLDPKLFHPTTCQFSTMMSNIGWSDIGK